MSNKIQVKEEQNQFLFSSMVPTIGRLIFSFFYRWNDKKLDADDHYATYDHEAFLSTEAKFFDQLTPEERN